MIQEDYVTFEQAKLLKEKGFPQDYLELPKSTIWKTDRGNIYYPKEVDMEGYAIPTLSLVHKWLREERGIVVDICTISTPIKDNFKVFMWQYFLDGNTWHYNVSGSKHNTYEEALSAGINKALELI